ncbi:hypothetical protein Pfo_004781 [Paulownia fortunei]|nr:hypothetical protein Pfo_004781 [Paulownia fortunei]
MAEGLGHDSLLLDDQSWAFPILAGDQENGGKMLTDIGNSDGQTVKDVEAPPAAKGKKRSAAASKPGGGDHGNEGKGGGGGQGSEGKGGGGGESDHELHIWTERERRKKMRNMFANLHALIPHLPPRADKSTIVDEAVLYIRKLQLTLEKLEKQKTERLNGATTNPTTCDPSVITQQKLAIQSREAFLAEQGSTSKAAVPLANPNSLNPLFSGPEFAATFKTWTSPNVILNVCGKDAHINVCCPKKPGLLTAIFFVMEKYKLEVVSAQVSSDRNRRMYMIHARTNGAPQQFPEALILVEEIYKQAATEIMLWVNS